jgi:hypothetical protein
MSSSNAMSKIALLLITEFKTLSRGLHTTAFAIVAAR